MAKIPVPGGWLVGAIPEEKKKPGPKKPDSGKPAEKPSK